jgi:hypothetical protein
MKENPYLKSAILEVVETQLKRNDPLETRQTFDRLIERCLGGLLRQNLRNKYIHQLGVKLGTAAVL